MIFTLSKPRLRLLPALLCLVFCGPLACRSNTVKDPNDVTGADLGKLDPLPPKERDQKLKEALGLIQGSEPNRGLEILYELANRNEEDQQVRYLLGRTLADLGRLRPARAELKRLIALNESHTLGLQRLGEIQQRLGENLDAIKHFERIAALVPDAIDPLRRVAANYLIRGEWDRALDALSRARERLKTAKRKDPVVEYLAFKLHLEKGDRKLADKAARAFVRISRKDAVYEKETRELGEWLKNRNVALADDDRLILLAYARSVLGRVVKEPNDPGSIAKKATERLAAFDDSSVFVTLIPPRGLGKMVSGRGKARNLMQSISAALSQILSNRSYNKRLAKRAALVISIQSGAFQVIETEKRGAFSVRLKNQKAFIPGLHGLAFDAGERQPYILPFEAHMLEISEPEALLQEACKRLRMDKNAWQRYRIFAFETASFVQMAPGAPLVELAGGEPSPRPAPSQDSIMASLVRAGEYLLKVQRNNGCFVERYWSRTDRALLDRTDEMAIVDFSDWVTVPVIAVKKTAKTPRFSVVKERLAVALDNPTLDTLKTTLDKLFGFQPEQTKLGDKSTNVLLGAAYQVNDESSESLRAMVEAELGAYSILKHLRACRSLAILSRLTDQARFRRAAHRAAAWALKHCAPKQGTDAMMLLALAELDGAELGKGQEARYQDARATYTKALVARLGNDGQLRRYRKERNKLEIGEAVLALTNEARLSRNDELLGKARRAALKRVMAWRKAMQARKALPLDSSFAVAISELYDWSRDQRLLDFCLDIADAFRTQIRDPGLDLNAAGGVDVLGRFPRGSTTARANRALAAAARASLMIKGLKAERVGRYRTACLAAAEFQLRHQIRVEHGYYLPNIERAHGGYRTSLFQSVVDINSVAYQVESLVLVLRMLKKTKQYEPK